MRRPTFTAPGRGRRALVVGAVAAGVFVSAAPPASALESSGQGGEQVTVERSTGQFVLSNVSIEDAGHVSVTVVDTRLDDPGWSVTVTGADGGTICIEDHTLPFTDSGGHTYAQQVGSGDVVQEAGAQQGVRLATSVSAPAHHGLGIAHLGAELAAVGPDGGSAGLSTVTVTVTVV